MKVPLFGEGEPEGKGTVIWISGDDPAACNSIAHFWKKKKTQFSVSATVKMSLHLPLAQNGMNAMRSAICYHTTI